MPRLSYPTLTDISTEAALRQHYASVGARLGRGVVKSAQDVTPPKAKWTAPQIKELKEFRAPKRRPLSAENNMERIRAVRRKLTDKSTGHEIIIAVATAWCVSVDEMLGRSRVELCIVPRSIAMTLCHKLAGYRFGHIADLFGYTTERGVRKQFTRYGRMVDEALASVEGKTCNTAR